MISLVMGKIDGSEKNYRKKFRDAYEFQNKILTTYYELLEKFNRFQGQSFVRQAAREEFISGLEDIEKKTHFTVENKNKMLSGFETVSSVIVSVSIFGLIYYTIGLFACLFGLIAGPPWALGAFIFIVTVILVNVYLFAAVWGEIRKFLSATRKLDLELEDFVLDRYITTMTNVFGKIVKEWKEEK
jgi:hypothetical protein